MPRKNVGKKLDVNGTLQDLGNTLSDEDLEKLDGIEENAQKNVQSDWNATSGDAYIKNKPTIPNVSNFITKDVNNLTNYTLSTGVGAKLGLSINTSTYVMTITLKNSSGTTLDTQTVDLPLESMVVDASYNKSTKEITLTLQNGTTTSFSVADLVSGLATQSALNTTNTNVANLTTKVSTAESNITKITNNTTKIADASGGFMGGTGAYSTFGAGAVGKGAAATGDAELGAYGGGAIGAGATSRHGAGAVGYYAKASQGGFAGGYKAVAITDTYDSQGNMMGSIQLGEGTNDTPLSLQVYGDNIYNAQTHEMTVKKIFVDGKDVALKDEGVFFVQGLTTTAEGTWAGTNSRITSYYDGLTINFKIGVAGHADGTTLNINSLGAKPCYLRGTTKITTHYAVGTMVILSYNATTDAFYSSDYDANNYAYARQYGNITTNAEYPVLFSQNKNIPETYTNRYTASQAGFTYNPNKKTMTVPTLKATTIYQNGKEVANKEDIPDTSGFAKTSDLNNYLPKAGGDVTGHIYLTGSKSASSTGNTSQIVFGTSSTNHVALSSNDKALVINPTTSTTTNQIVLYLDKASQFPKGITSSGTINANSIIEGGTSLVNKYLGKTAKASDSDKLDGNDSSYYVNTDDTAYKFAQAEYNKSLNLFNVNYYDYRYNSSLGLTNTFNNGSVTSSGNATSTYGEFGRFKVHLKANTPYTISFVKNNDAFAWFRNANGTNVKSAVFRGTKNSETFTLTEDAYYVDIGWENLVVGTSYNLSMSEIMIVEGSTTLPYQPYNSNKHITNSQAYLLMSEWEKCVNLYEVPNLSSVSANGLTWNVTNHLFNISGKSTGETSINFGDVPLSILKSGEQYKLYSTVPYNGSTFNISIAMQYSDGTMDWITPNAITTIKDNLTSARIALYCPGSGISYNYSNVGFTLFKAKYNVSQHHSYQGGELAHIGDIAGDLLWENASPNSAFIGYQNHSLSKSLNNYKSIKIVYKFNTSNNASYIDEFKTDGIGTGWRYIERRNYSRVFTLPNATTIRFEDGYIDSSMNDEAIIPLAVYGVK